MLLLNPYTAEGYLDLAEAADRLGISVQVLRRACRKAGLRHRVYRGTWERFVLLADVRAFPLITVGKAAKLIGVHDDTLRSWTRRGWARAARWSRNPHFPEVNRVLRFSLEEVERLRRALLKRRPQKPASPPKP